MLEPRDCFRKLHNQRLGLLTLVESVAAAAASTAALICVFCNRGGDEAGPSTVTTALARSACQETSNTSGWEKPGATWMPSPCSAK